MRNRKPDLASVADESYHQPETLNDIPLNTPEGIGSEAALISVLADIIEAMCAQQQRTKAQAA